MKREGKLGGLRALARLALTAAVCGGSWAAPGQAMVGKKAPAIHRKDLEGRPLDLSAYRGKVVLLNFWATWCAPCQAEMPRFIEWQRQYRPGGLQIVGISMDDEAAPARRLVARFKVNYPVAMGDEKIGALYGGILGLPVTFLIDRSGVIRAEYRGETQLSAIERELESLLKQHN